MRTSVKRPTPKISLPSLPREADFFKVPILPAQQFSGHPCSPPEARGIFAPGGYHVAGTQQRGIAVAHLQLQLRQIPEHGGVVRGEGVAADIRHPVAEPGGTA